MLKLKRKIKDYIVCRIFSNKRKSLLFFIGNRVGYFYLDYRFSANYSANVLGASRKSETGKLVRIKLTLPPQR